MWASLADHWATMVTIPSGCVVRFVTHWPSPYACWLSARFHPVNVYPSRTNPFRRRFWPMLYWNAWSGVLPPVAPLPANLTVYPLPIQCAYTVTLPVSGVLKSYLPPFGAVYQPSNR